MLREAATFELDARNALVSATEIFDGSNGVTEPLRRMTWYPGSLPDVRATAPCHQSGVVFGAGSERLSAEAYATKAPWHPALFARENLTRHQDQSDIVRRPERSVPIKGIMKELIGLTHRSLRLFCRHFNVGTLRCR